MKPTLIYIHGGDAFDTPFEALKTGVQMLWWKLKDFRKLKRDKWPATLETSLPEFEVLALKMPRKHNAKYQDWKAHFENEAASVSGDVVLVGWSLGANFLAKYLAEEKTNLKIKAVHLVAGCFGLGGGFWLRDDFPGSLSKYRVTLYHSKDDFVVDFADFERFQAALPQANTKVFTDRNHFLQPEFPELIQNLKSKLL